MDESHLRYAWAAYKHGWNALPVDMSPTAFKAQLIDTLSKFNGVFLLSASAASKPLFPVGILCILGTHRIEPHIDWFPWASPRNRIELLVRVARELRKNYKLMIYCKPADNSAFKLLRAYGLIKFGCKIERFFSDDTAAYFYFST